MKSIRILLMTIMIAVGAFACAASKSFTLVIDAGHGGHDSGAKGAMSYEKNINLKVALAFGKYVERNCPDVKVVYTRKTDVFVPLYERAEIANRNKANLFVSVHTNALPKGRISRGFETYTLGDGRSHGTKTNLDVAKRENSVIFMEKDYKQHYVGYDPNSPESNIMFEFVQDHNMQQSVAFAKLLQQNVCSLAGRVNKGVHQDNFAVLRLTSMPACLIELGFITTPDEEQALNNPTVVDKIARGIYNAFADYKNRQAGGLTVPFKAEADKLPAEDLPKQAAEDQPTEQMLEQPREQAQKLPKELKEKEQEQPKVQARQQPKVQARQQSKQPARKQSKAPANDLPVTHDGIIVFDEGPTRRMETPAEAAAVVKEFAPDAKPDKNVEAKEESKPEAKAESKPEAKAESKPEVKAESKPEAKAESKPMAKAESKPVVKAESKPKVKTVKKPESKPEAKADNATMDSSLPVFKVQIMVCHNKLKEGDRQLKGLKGCDYYQENGDWKCTYGASNNYNEIARMRKQILNLFPSCFIIAFKNGEKMNVNQAIKEFMQNKKR